VPYQYTLAAALVLASVYVFGHKLRAASHHRRWVSIAAGVSVSTVFLDLLPQISEGQTKFSNGPYRGAAVFPEQAIYLFAMLGFVLFYGLEYMVATSPSEDGEPNGIFSALRIAAFAAYSGLIAYLLIHNVWKNVSYEGRWRWMLALAVLVGWSVGIVTSIPEQWLLRIIGFVSGGVIMNTIVVELPEGRGGCFWLFVFSAAAYSAVLIVVLG